MELSPTQFLSGGFALAGVLLGAIITYSFALRLAARTARREAGRRLRDAFQPELAALNPVANFQGDVEDFLRAAWPRHHAAVMELMFHLPPKKQVTLEAAWQNYYLVGGSIRFFDYHFAESRDAGRAEFQKRVNAILKSTKN